MKNTNFELGFAPLFLNAEKLPENFIIMFLAHLYYIYIVTQGGEHIASYSHFLLSPQQPYEIDWTERVTGPKSPIWLLLSKGGLELTTFWFPAQLLHRFTKLAATVTAFSVVRSRAYGSSLFHNLKERGFAIAVGHHLMLGAQPQHKC